MTKQFETGKTYTIYSKNSTARFTATVTKRTACRVTFELSDMGREWCKASTVTLSVKKGANMVDADGNGLEMVVGKSKADHNAKFTRDLFALTDSER